jgi:hypothetical protein
MPRAKSNGPAVARGLESRQPGKAAAREHGKEHPVKTQWAPALVLFLLAPLCGELLSSSMPPMEWLNPVAVVMVVVLYGGGALLVREAVVRTGRGWVALLVLGAAYGILEEGLLCKSFFDPHWMDIGALGEYGRWAGVNWVWSLGLTVFHAVFSIAIPIRLVELMFPARRRDSWVSRRLMVVLGVLLAADVAVGYLAAGADEAAGRGPYRPPMLPYGLCALLVAALVAAALLWPRRDRPTAPPDRPPAAHVWFVLTGFAGSFIFFTITFSAPNLVASGYRPHPATAMVLLAAVSAATGLLVWRLSRGGRGWTDGRLLAAMAGAQGPFMLIALFAEVAPDRSDDPTGMALVAPAFLALHLVLAWVIRRRSRAAAAE